MIIEKTAATLLKMVATCLVFNKTVKNLVVSALA
jgi:hypothetical protein